MGCRLINNIRVNFSGNNISDEELSIHLNEVQSMLKSKIAKVDVSVDSEGVDIDYIYMYPLIKRIGKREGYLFRIHGLRDALKQAEEQRRLKLN